MIRTEKRKHIFLMLLLTATVLTGCVGGNPTLEQALKKTAEYEQETVTSPTSDSLGGEWTVIPLARSKEKVSEEYFKKYINTSNYITSEKQIKNIFSKAIQTISKNVAPVEKLVNLLSNGFSGISIAEAITSLCQLFTVNEHQLAGPEVIDPIILQEGKLTKRNR